MDASEVQALWTIEVENQSGSDFWPVLCERPEWGVSAQTVCRSMTRFSLFIRVQEFIAGLASRRR